MKRIESELHSHLFVRGMDQKYVNRLAECGATIEIPGGVYVFRQGQPAEEFYLILDGWIDVELFSASGGPVLLQKLGPGSVLGWSWLVAPYRWRFDARSVGPVRAIKIDAIRTREMMETDEKLGYELQKRFLQIIGERLESERMKLIELYASHS